MMKTREKLIEVARMLFAHKGVENTTMNDIASASEKGRRTIYTYFKSKREIYNAVVKTESDQIEARLKAVINETCSPEEKLMDFIFTRFEIVKDLVSRNGSLRAGFFRDVRKVERVRRYTTAQESAILEQILAEGVRKGAFAIKHIELTAKVMILCLQGMDVPFIRDNFGDIGIEPSKLREYIEGFILHGIKAQPQPAPADTETPEITNEL